MSAVIPELSRLRPTKLPNVAERTLDNGLRVLAVRRPGVPLIELRLRIPFSDQAGRHSARAQLLADTLLAGTSRRSAEQLAGDLQGLGASLATSVDSDRLGLGGSVLAPSLPAMLELLAEVLTAAAYPAHEVAGERDRLVQELLIYRSQAAVIAREALLRRLYGDHPYGNETPTGEAVAAVKPAALRALHAKRVSPVGALLVLVGDLAPARTLAAVEAALSGWTASGKASSPPELPTPVGGPTLLVDRPGAVQTSVRLAGVAPHRSHPDHPAFVLANLVFGGYFSSRWVANIREDKGYTYSPHSVAEHPPAGSRLTLATDVATDVTAPAILETLYELGRMATVAVPQHELDQARRYAVGALALSTSSQAGLASTVTTLAAADLDVSWLRTHPQALAKVTVEQVLQASARYLAPSTFTSVLVGDADVITDPVSRLLTLTT